MLCSRCGAQLPPRAASCNRCGASAGAPPRADAVAARVTGDSHARTRALLSAGPSGLATLAGYAGLLAVVLVPAPLAIVVGGFAIRDLRLHPERCGWGRAIFAVVAGVLGTAGLVALLLPG